MGISIRRNKAAFFALALLFTPPALAAVPSLEPMNYAVRYDVYWNNIPLGRVRITTHEDSFGYEVTVDTKTRGILALFDKQTSTASARGRVEENGYIPVEYRSRSADSDGARSTTLQYDSEGGLKSRARTPDDDPNWRKPVPTEQADTATDPITGFLRLRRAMHANIARDLRETHQRTYEGARLAEFTFTVISRARTEVMEEYHDSINIVPTRMPIAGYTPKEQKKFAEKGDPTVHVYFSADGRFIPLMAEAALPFGSLSARLTEFSRRE